MAPEHRVQVLHRGALTIQGNYFGVVKTLPNYRAHPKLLPMCESDEKRMRCDRITSVLSLSWHRHLRHNSGDDDDSERNLESHLFWRKESWKESQDTFVLAKGILKGISRHICFGERNLERSLKPHLFWRKESWKESQATFVWHGPFEWNLEWNLESLFGFEWNLEWNPGWNLESLFGFWMES